MTIQPMAPSIRPITGAPYCAEQHAQHFRTDANGAQHASGTEGVIHFCRDSRGRTYQDFHVDIVPSNLDPTPRPLYTFRVRDPVAGVQYIIDPQNHVAHRFPLTIDTELPSGAARGGPAPQANQQTAQRSSDSPDPKRPIITHVSLGTQIFEGEPAEGHRTVITYPTGSRGNDGPFSETQEQWISPYLKLPILIKITNPLSFDSVIRLTKITRNEPDPNLFLIPSDYKIVDENGPFEVTWYFN